MQLSSGWLMKHCVFSESHLNAGCCHVKWCLCVSALAPQLHYQTKHSKTFQTSLVKLSRLLTLNFLKYLFPPKLSCSFFSSSCGFWWNNTKMNYDVKMVFIWFLAFHLLIHVTPDSLPGLWQQLSSLFPSLSLICQRRLYGLKGHVKCLFQCVTLVKDRTQWVCDGCLTFVTLLCWWRTC